MNLRLSIQVLPSENIKLERKGRRVPRHHQLAGTVVSVEWTRPALRASRKKIWRKRKIGSQGLVAGAIGLGCMGMTHAYGTGDEAESIATIHRALDCGVTLLDTAEVYGTHTNEELVGKAIRGRRDSVVLATKFGIALGTGGMQVDGSPANAKRAVEGSLRRLGVDVIDLYYLHRKDPAVPIEETVGALKELVEAGKVRFLGLSEVGAETIRRACKVHPISAVQSEYSLWERGIEESILPAMRELGVGLVPFSPLGRGYSRAGSISSIDFRRSCRAISAVLCPGLTTNTWRRTRSWSIP